MANACVVHAALLSLLPPLLQPTCGDTDLNLPGSQRYACLGADLVYNPAADSQAAPSDSVCCIKVRVAWLQCAFLYQQGAVVPQLQQCAMLNAALQAAGHFGGACCLLTFQQPVIECHVVVVSWLVPAVPIKHLRQH